MTFKTQAVWGGRYGRVIVGVPDGNGFVFGFSADVNLNLPWTDGGEAEVSVQFGAVGALTQEEAKTRGQLLLWASFIARDLEDAIRSSVDLKDAVMAWDGQDLGPAG